jgi:hypothetical protein
VPTNYSNIEQNNVKNAMGPSSLRAKLWSFSAGAFPVSLATRTLPLTFTARTLPVTFTARPFPASTRVSLGLACTVLAGIRAAVFVFTARAIIAHTVQALAVLADGKTIVAWRTAAFFVPLAGITE